MSIEINSITKNKINKQNNNKNAAFKSNPLPQDKVELSSKKKELSNGSKIGIGIGIATVIGLGIELTIGKGKHLKTLWEKVRGKKPPKKPDGNPKTNVLPQITDFKNIDEAKAWFDNFGIKTEFRDVSNSDLVHINKIAKDFAELDRLGVTVSKPDSLVISDWNKKNELIRLLTERNINPDLGFSYAWGYAPISTDGTINIFLNINKLSNIAKGNIVQHEIGHQSRHIEDSVLKKINNLDNLGSKKLEILGYPTSLQHNNLFNEIKSDYCKTADNAEFIGSLRNDGDFCYNNLVLSGKGITDLFNREVTKGYNYKDYEADEYVADIFKFLTTGKTFSDEVMLAYDFIGGGRVPNLIIKGKSYDDYIKSLYDNPEMVQKLKNMVKPKIIAKNTEGQTILKDFNKEELDDLMEQWQSIFSPSAS